MGVSSEKDGRVGAGGDREVALVVAFASAVSDFGAVVVGLDVVAADGLNAVVGSVAVVCCG